MKITPGKRYLINTDEWFVAPDGETYLAVAGVVHGVESDEQTLGIKTNRGSSNWYVNIGGMVVAGCRIHYAVEIPNGCSFEKVGKDKDGRAFCRIYDADTAWDGDL